MYVRLPFFFLFMKFISIQSLILLQYMSWAINCIIRNDPMKIMFIMLPPWIRALIPCSYWPEWVTKFQVFARFFWMHRIQIHSGFLRFCVGRASGAPQRELAARRTGFLYARRITDRVLTKIGQNVRCSNLRYLLSLIHI